MTDTKRTGWPPGMLQDDSRELSRWLAQRPDAMERAREGAAAISTPAAQGSDPSDWTDYEAEREITEPNVGTDLDLDDLCDPAAKRAAFTLIFCIVAFLVYVLWP